MGRRGPPPKSKAELARSGSWRAKDREDELELDCQAPRMPSYLNAEAKAEWKRVVPILIDKGVVSSVDRAALTTLCESWSEYRSLIKKLKDFEQIVGSAEWKRVVSARNEAFARWEKMAARFGLTPADRPRVKAGKPKKQKDDGKGKFFQSKGQDGKAALAG